MPKKLENLVGQRFQTNQGYEVIVLEYFTSSNCTIKFENGYIKEYVSIDCLRKGEIINPFHKSLYERGFLGVGKYTKSTAFGHSDSYKVWKGMFRRCYSKNPKDFNPTYKDVVVCEHWYNFQNFAEWFENNYNSQTMEGWAIDKDILTKGNKIYSPETCCLVPKEINNLFTRRDSKRGMHPIGISYDKAKSRYISYISRYSKIKNLGSFNTVEEAFKAYKIAKEEYIKEVADKWKGSIDPKVYQAMYRYEVGITD